MENISKDKFEPIGIDIEHSNAVVRPSMTYWQDAWRRFKNNKIAVISAIIILLMCIMAIVGPMLTKYSFETNNLANIDQAPNMEHWFGTDELGRDLWARFWRGTMVSLSIGLIAAALDSVIGVLIGGLAGYYGGKVDMFIMRFIDVLNAIPNMIFIMLIMVAFGAGIFPIIISFAITGWIGMARLVRGQILQLKEQEFVLAARTLGAGSRRILFQHLIPNTLGIIIVNLTMRIPSAIFTEAFLSFIGLGVKPPESSWGQLAARGVASLLSKPYQLIIPSIFICITMLAFNLLGDGVRDALDPKMRK